MITELILSTKATSNDCLRLLSLALMAYGRAGNFKREKRWEENNIVYRIFSSYFSTVSALISENGNVLTIEKLEYAESYFFEGKRITEDPISLLIEPTDPYILGTKKEYCKPRELAKRASRKCGHEIPYHHITIKGMEYNIHIWWGPGISLDSDKPSFMYEMVIMEYPEYSILTLYTQNDDRSKMEVINHLETYANN
jgi:hypothetical protein